MHLPLYDPLTTSQYQTLIYAMLDTLERVEALPYLDTAGRVTIGPGLNIENSRANFDAVMEAFGLSNWEEGQPYIDRLWTAVRTIDNNTSLRTALDAIMAEAHQANDAIRSTFRINDDEAFDLFQLRAPTYETEINRFYTLAESTERAVFFTEAWNGNAALRSIGDRAAYAALQNNDHAEAFVALRYAANWSYTLGRSDAEQSATATRHYVISSVFDISNDPLDVEAATKVLRAGTKYENTISLHESLWGARNFSRASDHLNNIGADIGETFATRGNWETVSAPARNLLLKTFAEATPETKGEMVLSSDHGSFLYITSVNKVFDKVWVAAETRGQSYNGVFEVAAHRVDRSERGDHNLILGSIDEPGSNTGAADTLIGGSGWDLFISSNGADVFNGGDGVDAVSYAHDRSGISIQLNTSASTGDTLKNIECLIGTEFNDIIGGGAGSNQFIGLGGSDVIRGRGGSDSIYGGRGDDVIYSGSVANDLADRASNQLNGGWGNDTAYGAAGTDHIVGAQGSDTLYGGNGSDAIFGDYSNVGYIIPTYLVDIGSGARPIGELYGNIVWGDGIWSPSTANGLPSKLFRGADGGADDLYGGNGRDLIFGGFGHDLIEGGADDDHLLGGIGDDAMFGGSGHDVLNGGAGRDILDGGEGSDVYWCLDGTSDIINDTGSNENSVDLVVFNTSFIPRTKGTIEIFDYIGTTRLTDVIREDAGYDVGHSGSHITAGAQQFALHLGRGSDTIVLSGNDAQDGVSVGSFGAGDTLDLSSYNAIGYSRDVYSQSGVYIDVTHNSIDVIRVIGAEGEFYENSILRSIFGNFEGGSVVI